MYKYTIFGLSISSEIHLTGHEYYGNDFDVFIIEDKIDNHTNNQIFDKRMKTILTIPQIAKFYV